jgi:hypothetical protein
MDVEISDNSPGICLRELRKITKISRGIGDVPTDIRIVYLPNTSQKLYRLNSLPLLLSLKHIKQLRLRTWTGLIMAGWGPVASFGNELSGFENGGKFLD